MADVVYEVSFKGAASPAVRACFGEYEVRVEKGVTVVRGRFADQAALHGVLSRIEDLALELVEVRRLPDTDADPGPPTPLNRAR